MIRVFFAEQISRCHAGGYWFDVEGIVFNAGLAESVGSALGQTETKWGARRKIRKHKREILKRVGCGEPGGGEARG